MEAVRPSIETMLWFNISSLSRVTSTSLHPRKHWYVLKKEIRGIRLTDFSQNKTFKRFSVEVQSVVTRELETAKSVYAAMEFNRMSSTTSTIYVASTCGWLSSSETDTTTLPVQKASTPECDPFDSAEPVTTPLIPTHPESGCFDEWLLGDFECFKCSDWITITIGAWSGCGWFEGDRDRL